MWIELDDLSSAAEGNTTDGHDYDDVALVRGTHGDVPLRLRRVALNDGTPVWVLSRQTVASIPELFDLHGPAPFAERLPRWATATRVLGVPVWQLAGIVVALFLAGLLGMLVGAVVRRVGGRLAKTTRSHIDDALVRNTRGPLRVFLGLVFFLVLLRPLRLAIPIERKVDALVAVGFIAATGWLAVRAVALVAEVIETRGVEAAEKEGDFGRARGVRTQVLILRRVLVIFVWVLTAALVALQFETVRSVGVSLLASAGVAGIALGIAAQRSLGGLLAGVQLSITQPMRIGDTVIIDGEYGTVENINLTYVVVRIWDKRRLIVPVSRFLEQSFENWTKVSPDLLGTVFIHADYSLPVEAMRAELERVVDTDARWDRKAKGLVVTNATDRTIEIRVTVSAGSASELWDLRCHVREKLVSWLRGHEGGRHLPRTRIEGEELVHAGRSSAS